jgi:hypothetical protein
LVQEIKFDTLKNKSYYSVLDSAFNCKNNKKKSLEIKTTIHHTRKSTVYYIIRTHAIIHQTKLIDNAIDMYNSIDAGV